MLNRLYEAIEEVLDSLDVGGEQSRQFVEEIGLLREVIGHPKAVDGVLDEISRRHLIVQKLRRLAVEAEGLAASLPTLPVAKWLDGTVADATVDVYFEDYDLSALLQFVADVGVSQDG
jgi:predicted kinase